MSIDFTPTKKKINFTPTKNKIDFKPTEKKIDFIPSTSQVDFKSIGGEEKNKFDERSNFGKIIDIISRPSYGVTSTIDELRKQTPKLVHEHDPDKWLWQDIKKWKPVGYKEAEKPFSIKELAKAFKKGVTGEERKDITTMMRRSGARVPAGAFAMEVATDPLTYLAAPITKGIGKGLSVASKTAKKVPLIAKTIDKVKTLAQPVTSQLRKMFITKTGINQLDEIIEKNISKIEYTKAKHMQYGIKARNVIQNTSKKTGQSIDDIEKQVSTLITNPQANIEVANETRVLSNTMRSTLSRITTGEMKAGVPISYLSKGAPELLNLPKITKKEALTYLKQAKIGNKKVYSYNIAKNLNKRTGDFTLKEFDSFLTSHNLKGLGGESVEQFLMKDSVYKVVEKGLKSIKASTTTEFLDDAGKTFGMSSDDAIKQGKNFYQPLSKAAIKLNPSLKDKVFDPEIASEISRYTTEYFNPKEVNLFMQGFDKVQTMWKKWTLAPFPQYHLRNMVGNTWNNYLAGVEPVNYSKAQAIQMWRKYKIIPGKRQNMALSNLKLHKITTQAADDIIVQAEKTGVVGKGWYGADIEEGIKKEIGKGFLRKSLKTKAGKITSGDIIIEKGMAFGTTIENNARMAHFIDRLNKGDDVFAASKSVKKFLFDYGDLTQFEKTTMKRFFPFYTWTRKNIPLQLEQLWQHPEKFMKAAPAFRARNEQDLLKLKYANPNLYDRLPVEYKRTADTVTYIPLEGLLPGGDLAKLATNPQEMFVEMLTPGLKYIMEEIFNKSLYFDSEIQKYDKETQEFLRQDISPKIKHALTTILPQARLLNELNKLVRKKIEGKEELTTDEKILSKTLTSIYKVSHKELKNRALYHLRDKATELQRGYARAKRKDRTKEMERIKKTLAEYRELMKKIKE